MIGSIISIMEMLCRRASLAVSSFARDSTGTKDLNGIEELSRCYLKNEESVTERERVKCLRPSKIGASQRSVVATSY